LCEFCLVCACKFQTKHFLQKDTVSEHTEHSKYVEETRVSAAANLDCHDLPTDICSCSEHLKGAGANNTESLENDACMTLSKTCNVSSNNLFTPVTLFVNSQTALNELVSEHHGTSSSHRLMLTGLHTCGNLSADILRLFGATPSAEVVCQVGCCYNLLSERFLNFPGIPAHGNSSVCSDAITELLDRVL